MVSSCSAERERTRPSPGVSKGPCQGQGFIRAHPGLSTSGPGAGGGRRGSGRAAEREDSEPGPERRAPPRPVPAGQGLSEAGAPGAERPPGRECLVRIPISCRSVGISCSPRPPPPSGSVRAARAAAASSPRHMVARPFLRRARLPRLAAAAAAAPVPPALPASPGRRPPSVPRAARARLRAAARASHGIMPSRPPGPGELRGALRRPRPPARPLSRERRPRGAGCGLRPPAGRPGRGEGAGSGGPLWGAPTRCGEGGRPVAPRAFPGRLRGPPVGRPPGIVSLGGGGKFPAVSGRAAGPPAPGPRPPAPAWTRRCQAGPRPLAFKASEAKRKGGGRVGGWGKDSQSGLGVCSREDWEVARVFPACTILGPAAFSESDVKFKRKKKLAGVWYPAVFIHPESFSRAFLERLPLIIDSSTSAGGWLADSRPSHRQRELSFTCADRKERELSSTFPVDSIRLSWQDT